jgi:hypothetical protein
VVRLCWAAISAIWRWRTLRCGLGCLGCLCREQVLLHLVEQDLLGRLPQLDGLLLALPALRAGDIGA